MDQEVVFGRIRAARVSGGDIMITRAGRVGHGGAASYRLWDRAQTEAVLAAASQRRGPDAADERKALQWALHRLCEGAAK